METYRWMNIHWSYSYSVFIEVSDAYNLFEATDTSQASVMRLSARYKFYDVDI